jgi:hypothetical protein
LSDNRLMAELDVARILDLVRDRLNRARRALELMGSTRGRARTDAFEDVLIHGRAVTNTMETLRGKVPDFDTWYKPKTAALRSDVVFRRFYAMRNELLHQGMLAIDQPAIVADFGEQLWCGTPPAGATNLIVHDDDSGKWGWLVEQNGQTERVLHDYPTDVIVTERFEFPMDFRGELDIEVVDEVARYLSFLTSMFDELQAFTTPAP